MKPKLAFILRGINWEIWRPWKAICAISAWGKKSCLLQCQNSISCIYLLDDSSLGTCLQALNMNKLHLVIKIHPKCCRFHRILLNKNTVRTVLSVCGCEHFLVSYSNSKGIIIAAWLHYSLNQEVRVQWQKAFAMHCQTLTDGQAKGALSIRGEDGKYLAFVHVK